ncbi:MAG: DedA family protein [Prevotellaceae bacterium]|jgi:membrane protein YqaA with SNARE-associated domain|nr:DedA family protein [Prevotellaceae bacterium]
MEFFAEWGFLGLFVVSFLAATILPFGSEVLFVGMIFSGYNAWACVFVATVGNWLGGLTCYYIGSLGKIEWVEKYLKIKKESLDKYLCKIQKYGSWFAFFAFVPFVGDIIAVAAGYMRCKFWSTAFAILCGKFIRYLLLMYANNMVL